MSILKAKQKRIFSVNCKKDLAVFSEYLKKDSWGKEGCPFEVEHPWRSIPDMIKDKIARKYLGIQ
jgi:hypothetical protein